MDDLISRQAALDAISCNITITGRQNAELVAETIGMFADRIKDLPSAEPQRKKGRWVVFKAPDKYHCGLCKCPFCGEEIVAEPDEYNFCSNCGADMRGEQE